MLEIEQPHGTPVIILDTISTSKDSVPTLFELINKVSKELYLAPDFDVNPPVAVDGSRAEAGVVTDQLTGNQSIYVRNTRLLISPRVYKDMFNTPKVSVGFKHESIVFYDRIHISDIPDTTIVRGSAITVYDVLDKLKVKTGLSFSKDDLYNASLPAANAGGYVTVPLRIKETSLRYYESTKVFSGTKLVPATPSTGGIDLAAALTMIAALTAQVNALTAKVRDSRIQSFSFSSSLTWKINHHYMTSNFAESITNATGERIYAPIRIISPSEFWIEFTEPETGTVSVIFEVSP